MGSVKSYNKLHQSLRELHPLERTPQSNEESVDAKIYATEEDVAIHQ